ncbi:MULTISPECIES: hypothetical protein [unclassified Okeania]|uniref:hypothetical protein n=1 Tax=unclassified Okeania TaxID=2634635 RepID=UPI0013BD181F|nr:MULTISPECIES: hypothetical protein [unclassified Okeania]NET18394.1 hypothetical protein [Okeania sp. SIO1H5]NET80272.1 hypothetical protein [Okeania sp. SIO1F9]NET92253.1 hypothetical protein [Okeania sp. SIO1H2]
MINNERGGPSQEDRVRRTESGGPSRAVRPYRREEKEERRREYFFITNYPDMIQLIIYV